MEQGEGASEGLSKAGPMKGAGWLTVARVTLWAPIPVVLALLLASLVGWLPAWFGPDHIWAIGAVAFGVSLIASWLAGRGPKGEQSSEQRD